MSVLAPRQRMPLTAHLFEDDRPTSRADSVLDYYSQAAGSRESSPAPRATTETGNGAKIAKLNRRTSNRVSDSFMYDEFGLESRYESLTSIDRGPDTRDNTQTTRDEGNLTQPESLVTSSSSLSRIPVSRDRHQQPSNAGLATRKTYVSPKIGNDGHEAYSTHDTAMERTGSSDSSHMTRSSSVPLSHLMTAQSASKHHSSELFASMPSRNPNKQTRQTSIRRAASLSARPRPVEEKDARVLREEQARRIQAVNQAPEGAPPWLGKFQPDPRLPADQQLLPTVARKLALEQWIGDGGAEESFDDMWEARRQDPGQLLKRTSMLTYSLPLQTQTEEAPSPASSHVGPAFSSTDSTKSNVLGQNPVASLHRQVSWLSIGARNFSRRSLQSLSRPAVPGSSGSHSSSDPEVMATALRRESHVPPVADDDDDDDIDNSPIESPYAPPVIQSASESVPGPGPGPDAALKPQLSLMRQRQPASRAVRPTSQFEHDDGVADPRVSRKAACCVVM